jgi:hypothetical protein
MEVFHGIQAAPGLDTAPIASKVDLVIAQRIHPWT